MSLLGSLQPHRGSLHLHPWTLNTPVDILHCRLAGALLLTAAVAATAAAGLGWWV